MMFDSIPSSMPLVKGGKLRFLAVVSDKRSALLPDVPTMAEAGYPGMNANNLYGFAAPKGTPPQIIATLDAALRKVLAMPDLKETLAAQGADLIYGTGAQMGQQTAEQYKSWAEVVKSAHLKLD
jgi:tripartite-type tricarboxylate transporter receptor subunit TctC